jgi:hypothetical protein
MLNRSPKGQKEAPSSPIQDMQKCAWLRGYRLLREPPEFGNPPFVFH